MEKSDFFSRIYINRQNINKMLRNSNISANFTPTVRRGTGAGTVVPVGCGIVV